jgi:hypothetical protein
MHTGGIVHPHCVMFQASLKFYHHHSPIHRRLAMCYYHVCNSAWTRGISLTASASSLDDLIVQVNGGGASFPVCGRIPVGAGQLGCCSVRDVLCLVCLLWSAKLLADGDVAPTTRLYKTIIFAAPFRVWYGMIRPRRLAIWPPWPLMSSGPWAPVKQWQS